MYGTYVVEVAMCDEHCLLVNCTLGATPDVKRNLQNMVHQKVKVIVAIKTLKCTQCWHT